MSSLIDNRDPRVDAEVERKTRPRQVIENGGLKSKSTKTASQLGAAEVGKMLLNWPNRSEVWPLTYGFGICGVMAGATGFYINYKIRSFMYMLHVGRISTYSAVAVFPAVSAGLGHYIFVLNDILEQKTKCPVCVQVKSGVTQGLAGVLYPCLITPVALFPILSKMKKSFVMPNLITNPKETLKFFKDLCKPFQKYLVPIAAFQTICAMGLAYFEQDAYLTNVDPYLNPKVNSLLEDVS